MLLSEIIIISPQSHVTKIVAMQICKTPQAVSSSTQICFWTPISITYNWTFLGKINS